MYMVSMKDIAKQCNVSVASVSKALNGYPDISEETRQLDVYKRQHMDMAQANRIVSK